MAIMDLFTSLQTIINERSAKKVRQSIHDGIFRANQVVDANRNLVDQVAIRQDAVEQYNNQMITEMTDKDVVSAPELIESRDGEVKLSARLARDKNEFTAQLAQIAISPDGFKEAGDVDDGPSIQRAIDYLNSIGTGTVLIAKQYNIRDTIYLKENVSFDFKVNGLLNYTKLYGTILVVHDRTYTKGLSIKAHRDYEGEALLFTSDLLYGDLSIVMHDTKLFKDRINTENDSVGVKFFAKDSEIGTGYYGITMKGLHIDGFHTGFETETQGTGWVNSNLVTDVHITNFVRFDRVIKSAESQGIDKNIFRNVVGQVKNLTRRIMNDEFLTSNIYDNFYFWDIHLFPDAEIGLAPNFINYGGKDALSGSLYASDNFVKLGTFDKLDSVSRYLILSIKRGNLDIDSEFSISYSHTLGTTHVVRKHYGSNQLNKDRLRFYRLTKENGNVEIYMRVYNTTYDTDVRLVTSSRFTPDSTKTKYTNVPGAVEFISDESHDLSTKKHVSMRSMISTQQIANDTASVLVLNSPKFDTDSIYGANNTLTVKRAGKYFISIKLSFGTNSVGFRQFRLVRNGVEQSALIMSPAVAGVNTILSATEIDDFAEGETIQISCRQNSGGALDAGGNNSFVSLVRVD